MFDFLKRRPKEQIPKKYYCEKEELKRLDQWGDICPVTKEEEEDLKLLRNFIADNNIQLYCSFSVWNDFFEHTVLTGNISKFCNYINDYTFLHKAEAYHLVNAYEIRVATVEK